MNVLFLGFFLLEKCDSSCPLGSKRTKPAGFALHGARQQRPEAVRKPRRIFLREQRKPPILRPYELLKTQEDPRPERSHRIGVRNQLEWTMSGNQLAHRVNQATCKNRAEATHSRA